MGSCEHINEPLSS